ncbi:hypothetical protein AGMMS4956_16230 [Bacteroidia bacterium]|nr:hypothetical protein AGMMS4956_16230 [Bacteroidia bacterium]
MQIELYQFKNLCMEMAELGAANYAKEIAPASDQISQRKAYSRFGETKVKRWEHEKSNLLHIKRAGNSSRSKKLYSLAELLAIEKAEKYIPVLLKA